MMSDGQNQLNKTMRRINYQSDFTAKLTLTDSNGEPMAVPANPWSVHFTDEAGTCFKCCYDGSTYEDCAVIADAIVCYVNNPGYMPGVLSVTFCNDVPDANFADDYNNQVTPVSSQILLWDGATDAGESIDMGIMLQVIAPRVIDATIEEGDLILTFNN